MKKYPFKTSTAAVRHVMLTGGWWTGPSMQKEVRRLTGHLFSESGITARIRELRDEFDVPSRLKAKSTSFEYQLINEKKKAA